MSLLDRIDVLKKVVDVLPVGVWLMDETGRILYGNSAGQRIVGGAHTAGVDRFRASKGWWVATGKPIAVDEWAASRAIHKGEIAINEEIEIECLDGTHKVILNSAIPIRNENGAIVGAMVVDNDITERKRFEDHLRSLADRDPLTNAYNRRALFDFLDAEIHRVRRYGDALSVIMFDIDHFKDVNDDHGHAVGDRVLVAIAEIVREELRSMDRLARHGGDEFLIIAPNTSGAKAVTLAERLRASIAGASFDTRGRVTCSFGVCQFDGGEDADNFIRRADQLMYRAKRSGRNAVAAE
jgi:diguanylate cyclase (GGDEF)-like protein/PAS domain S-box-containing protein